MPLDAPARLLLGCIIRQMQTFCPPNLTDALAMQGLHSVAFTGGLANPLVAQEGAAHRLTADVIADFIASNYSAERMVLVGAHPIACPVRKPQSLVLSDVHMCPPAWAHAEKGLTPGSTPHHRESREGLPDLSSSLNTRLVCIL